VKLGGHREEAVKAAHKRKGEALDGAQALRGLIAPFVEAGKSRGAIAAALNEGGHRTERGSLWKHTTVGRVIERLNLLMTSMPLLAGDMMILLLIMSSTHEIQP